MFFRGEDLPDNQVSETKYYLPITLKRLTVDTIRAIELNTIAKKEILKSIRLFTISSDS
jgi:hypothetical protein